MVLRSSLDWLFENAEAGTEFFRGELTREEVVGLIGDLSIDDIEVTHLRMRWVPKRDGTRSLLPANPGRGSFLVTRLLYPEPGSRSGTAVEANQ